MILFFENRERNTEMKAMSNAELRLKNEEVGIRSIYETRVSTNSLISWLSALASKKQLLPSPASSDPSDPARPGEPGQDCTFCPHAAESFPPESKQATVGYFED